LDLVLEAGAGSYRRRCIFSAILLISAGVRLQGAQELAYYHRIAQDHVGFEASFDHIDDAIRAPLVCAACRGAQVSRHPQEGPILALRGADLRLMQLERAGIHRDSPQGVTV